MSLVYDERFALTYGMWRAAIPQLLVGSYRVVYRIEAPRVAVLTVRHLRRRFDPEEIG